MGKHLAYQNAALKADRRSRRNSVMGDRMKSIFNNRNSFYLFYFAKFTIPVMENREAAMVRFGILIYATDSLFNFHL